MGDVHEHKYRFVKDFVKPMCLAMRGVNITDIEYKYEEPAEVVVVTYEGGMQLTVHVDYDSDAAIVKDLVRQGAFR